MKIISNFTDYYDKMKAWSNEDITIERMNKIIPYKKPKGHYNIWKNYIVNEKIGNLQFDTYIVGFCGKIYPAIKVTSDVSKFYYDKKKFVEFLDKNKITKLFSFKNSITNKKIVDNIYNPKTWNGFMDLFTKTDIESFLFYPSKKTDYTMELHPKLIDINFNKVFKPYEAYLEVCKYAFRSQK